MLGLDTDSDYEDEEPSHMPGFVNEPAYSTVYETLMDKPPEEYAMMVAALPNFVELLQSDLQAIAARVGHERGLEVAPSDPAEADNQDGDLGDGASPSTGSARPPESDQHDIVAEEGEVVEIEVEAEEEETVMVQVGAKVTGGGQNTKHCNSAHRNILLLRDWLEDKWEANYQVHDMVDVARNHLKQSLRDPQELARGQEWFQLIPCGPARGQPARWEDISPSQRDWAKKVVSNIAEQVHMEMEEEKACLMQRTLTGMVPHMHVSEASLVNSELEQLSEDEAREAARALHGHLRQHASRITAWEQIEAVLVAHSPGTAVKAEETGCSEKVRAWVSMWTRRLTPPMQSRAASSHERPEPDAEEGADQLQEERAVEEDMQRQADEELFQWHTMQAAREAQIEDRAAVLARMGWTVKVKKQWRLDVTVQTEMGQNTMSVPMSEGGTVNLQMTTKASTEHEYRYQGRLQEPDLARKRMAEAEEEHHVAEKIRGEKGVKRRSMRTDDPEIHPFYLMWERGEVEWAKLVTMVGEDTAKFIQIAAEVQSQDVATPAIPMTQLYETQTQHAAPSVSHHFNPDEMDTVPMANLSDASTVLMEPNGPDSVAEK